MSICEHRVWYLCQYSIATNPPIKFCTSFSLQTSKAQFDKIISYIKHGKNEGATLLTGGKPIGNKGYYIEPTIFANVKVYFKSTKKHEICIFNSYHN